MTIDEWGILIGAMTTIAVGFVPWMLMVHAKLAVVASQVAKLDAKLERLFETQQQRLGDCARHEAELNQAARQLEQHGLQLDELRARVA